jgi:hypothetical protein
VAATDVQNTAPQQACHHERYFKESTMNHLRSTTATAIRSVFSRRGLQGAVLAGIAAASIGAAGAASASTAHAGPAPKSVSHHIGPNGWAPAEECLTWSGTVKYFPVLSTTSKTVTAVLNATGTNCEIDGQQQGNSATVFGTLSGTATKSSATLSGNVAVTWPSDAQLEPTIASISLNTSSGIYSFTGSITAGAFAGNELWGSYEKTGQSAISGGTNETILGSAPFAVMEDLG